MSVWEIERERAKGESRGRLSGQRVQQILEEEIWIRDVREETWGTQEVVFIPSETQQPVITLPNFDQQNRNRMHRFIPHWENLHKYSNNIVQRRKEETFYQLKRHKETFSVQGCVEWNKLPIDIRQCPTFTTFKGQLTDWVLDRQTREHHV